MPKLLTSAADREDVRDTWPFIAIIVLMIVVGYVSALRSVESLQEPGRLALFTALLLLITGLFLVTPVAIGTPRRRLIVLTVLAGALFWIGLLLPNHWLVMGLFPGLAGLAVGAYWPDLSKSFLAAALCFGLMGASIAIGKSQQEFFDWLPFAGLAFVFVFVYVTLFIRQVEARKRAQILLEDLERAHAKLQEYSQRVEELTLAQERERMGHELHDTLAQGLAGLIMQLEAADHHLEAGATDRAREVVQQAMRRARTAHHEARRAIQALRASVLEHGSLVEALHRETERLEADAGIPCRFVVSSPPPELPPETAQHILRIVQESLTNVARHAEATQVELHLASSDEGLELVIEDDGKGFELSREAEGFGLAGMRERAARIGGELSITTSATGGTRIELALERGAS